MIIIEFVVMVMNILPDNHHQDLILTNAAPTCGAIFPGNTRKN